MSIEFESPLPAFRAWDADWRLREHQALHDARPAAERAIQDARSAHIGDELDYDITAITHTMARMKLVESLPPSSAAPAPGNWPERIRSEGWLRFRAELFAQLGATLPVRDEHGMPQPYTQDEFDEEQGKLTNGVRAEKPAYLQCLAGLYENHLALLELQAGTPDRHVRDAAFSDLLDHETTAAGEKLYHYLGETLMSREATLDNSGWAWPPAKMDRSVFPFRRAGAYPGPFLVEERHQTSGGEYVTLATYTVMDRRNNFAVISTGTDQQFLPTPTSSILRVADMVQAETDDPVTR